MTGGFRVSCDVTLTLVVVVYVGALVTLAHLLTGG